MVDLAHSSVVQALAWTLTHFLWQGAVIAIAALALMRAAVGRATIRYAVGVGALAAMLAAPCITFLRLATPAALPTTPGISAPAHGVVAPAPPRSPASGAAAATFTPAPPPSAMAAVVVLWLAGVFMCSVRLLGGWVLVRRITRRAVQPAAVHIQAMASQMAERLSITRAVAVLESSAVSVPVLIGWLKPAIVLPVAALAGLSPTQIEALLAHELAHVRRHDYLVNVLQSVAEAVLFYHPAVWWMSRRVRMERELCCDDLAVGVCDRLVYATALTDLATMTSPRLALAATDGDLLSRVRRILGNTEADLSFAKPWSSAVGLVLVAGLIVPVSLFSARRSSLSSPAGEDTAVAQAAVSAPQSGSLLTNGAATPAASGSVTLMKGRTAAAKPEVADKAQSVSLDMGDVAVGMGQGRPSELVSDTVARDQKTEQARREDEMRARQEADIEGARRELERVRKLFEVGLVSSTQVLEAETRLAVLAARGNAEATRAVEIAAAERLLADARLRAEIGTMSASGVAEAEARLALLHAQGDAQQSLKAELEAVRQQYEHAMQLYERGLIASAALHDAEVRLANLQQRLVIAAGDLLSIVIAGEPDLPTTYRVQADGTIRLPLLGVFKVVGRTTAQVQEAIGQQLADRRLGSAAQVHVARRQTSRVP